MSNLLYRVRDGKVSFRRHSPHYDELSMFFPEELQGEIEIDQNNDIERQIRLMVQRSKWVGNFYGADTEVGKAMMGRRSWDVGRTEVHS